MLDGRSARRRPRCWPARTSPACRRATSGAGRGPHLPDRPDLQPASPCCRTPCSWPCCRTTARRGWRWWRRPAHRADEALVLLAQVGMQDQADRPAASWPTATSSAWSWPWPWRTRRASLLMDEPTAGMAPAERLALMQLVRRLARERRHGRAVHRAQHGRGLWPGRPRGRAGVRPVAVTEGPPEAMRQDARAGGVSGRGLEEAVWWPAPPPLPERE